METKRNYSIRKLEHGLLKLQVQYKDQRDGYPRYNAYLCSNCNVLLKAVEMAPGVTPFNIDCPDCHKIGSCKSQFYNEDVIPLGDYDVMFYRPNIKDLMKLRRKQEYGTINHVLAGGLIYKFIKRKENKDVDLQD